MADHMKDNTEMKNEKKIIISSILQKKNSINNNQNGIYIETLLVCLSFALVSLLFVFKFKRKRILK